MEKYKNQHNHVDSPFRKAVVPECPSGRRGTSSSGTSTGRFGSLSANAVLALNQGRQAGRVIDAA
ncbi:hypothetical protein ACGFWF_29035 [Streptomyces sp. NPDC048581]|uniref:hypothetical protein n=1 Tax=Streptomyces sp. NPDC048581 TaxID=3365572 RepID=UPI0037110694